MRVQIHTPLISCLRWVQVQTIGLLSHLRAKGDYGPFMVIGPLSTLPNWVAEFKRWCPSFPAILYHGSKNERQELRDKHMPFGEWLRVSQLTKDVSCRMAEVLNCHTDGCCRSPHPDAWKRP